MSIVTVTSVGDERVRACLIQLTSQEKMLLDQSGDLSQIKKDRDDAARKMRKIAGDEPLDEEDDGEMEELEAVTKRWAKEADKFEIGDRRKRRLSDSVHKLTLRFFELNRARFGLSGALPFDNVSNKDAWKEVEVADLLGGDMMAQPFIENGFIVIKNLVNASDTIKVRVKGGRFTQAQADYLLEAVHAYLDKAGVPKKDQESIPRPSKKNAAARHFAAEKGPEPEPGQPESPQEASEASKAADDGAPERCDAPKGKRGRPKKDEVKAPKAGDLTGEDGKPWPAAAPQAPKPPSRKPQPAVQPGDELTVAGRIMKGGKAEPKAKAEPTPRAGREKPIRGAGKGRPRKPQSASR